MSRAVTREQVVATLNTIRVVAELIKTIVEVPNGELYAQVMQYLSFDQYC